MNFGQKLRAGLAKSAKNLIGGIKTGFGGGKMDAASLDALEDALILADFGPKFAHEIVDSLKSTPIEGAHKFDTLQHRLAEKIEKILSPLARPMVLSPDHKPQIILVTGVNGSGKTTSIGKLAHYYQQAGEHSHAANAPRKIMVVAADIFRAAAVTQLQIWAERAGVTCITAAKDSDPAALVYQALEKAERESYDLVLIDTAGRLQNNQALMDELGKILRVIKKRDATAPHHSLLVMDATIGQNALRQTEQFRAQAAITGLVITKLDGTAKAGIIVALAEKFALPIHAIGVGEAIDDLRPFDAGQFARNLLDLA